MKKQVRTGSGTKGKGKSLAIVSDKVKDYGNDPYFVAKAEESRFFLEKHGFPKELMLSKSRSKKKAKA